MPGYLTVRPGETRQSVIGVGVCSYEGDLQHHVQGGCTLRVGASWQPARGGMHSECFSLQQSHFKLSRDTSDESVLILFPPIVGPPTSTNRSSAQKNMKKQ
jgi:hypothetical protein